MAATRICSIPECGKKSVGKGFCHGHYFRLRKHGDPLAGRSPRTPKGSALRFIESALSVITDDCVVWPFPLAPSSRYPIVYTAGRGTTAHRVVCRLAHGEPSDEKLEAAHSCHNTRCCNPRHLRWATTLENQRDRYADGTHNMGERNGAAKLTEKQVRSIRAKMKRHSVEDLAESFSVSPATIYAIRNGDSWGWLP